MKKTMIRMVPALVLILMTTAFMTAPACSGNRAASQITDLGNVEQLRQRIQQDTGKVKLVALLSPV
jgi:hypothetical protein